MKLLTKILLGLIGVLLIALIWMRGQYVGTEATLTKAREEGAEIRHKWQLKQKAISDVEENTEQLQKEEEALSVEYETLMTDIENAHIRWKELERIVYSYPEQKIKQSGEHVVFDYDIIAYGDIKSGVIQRLNLKERWDTLDIEVTPEGEIFMLLENKISYDSKCILVKVDSKKLEDEPAILYEESGDSRSLLLRAKPLSLSANGQFIVLNNIGWERDLCKVFSVKTLEEEKRPFEVIKKTGLTGKVKFIGFEPDSGYLLLQIGQDVKPMFIKYDLLNGNYSITDEVNFAAYDYLITDDSVFILGQGENDETLQLYRDFDGYFLTKEMTYDE